MIKFQKYTLNNGLRVIIHEDHSTPLVCVSVAYNVGSKHEHPDKTGFAHLFEHLMFGGSANIKDFDKPMQLAGGDNNAYTNNDMTNFYDIMPAENMEIAFWLESDRMMQLTFNEKVLNTQKKVVIEEFKETCLNEPYGDMWHHLSSMAYQQHPYSWPTIGKEINHIAQATLEDVKSFFYNHYRPDNAVLTIAGKTDAEFAYKMAEKWFGDIPRGNIPQISFVPEPRQYEKRSKVVHADVPSPAIYMAFPMAERLSKDYYIADLITDLLANGRSSRFYKHLYKEKKMFSTIDAFVSGYTDCGLLLIEGKPMPGIDINLAKEAIWEELRQLMHVPVPADELAKLRNTLESSLVYSEVSILNKALALGYFEILGNADRINEEGAIYQSITQEDLMRVACEIFRDDNLNELIYIPEDSDK